MQVQLSARAPAKAAAALGGVAARRAAPLAARPLRLQQRRPAPAIAAVLNVTESDFEAEVLKSDVPVLVDFWAAWCGPCKLMHMIMDWAEKEYGGNLKVVKVEADPNPNLIKSYEVYGLPTFIVFKDGAPVADSKSEGALTKKALAAYLEKHGIQAPVTAA